MLRHIVMINFSHKENLAGISAETKKMLLALEQSIEPLIKMEVGLNLSSRPAAFDLVLVADFKDEHGLNIYRDHPEHIKVLAYLKGVVEKTAVVDYII